MIEFITENVLVIATVSGFIIFMLWKVRTQQVITIGKECSEEYYKLKFCIKEEAETDNDLIQLEKEIHDFFEKYSKTENPGCVRAMAEELHALVEIKHYKLQNNF